MKIKQVKKWFMTAFVGVLALCSLATVPFEKTGVVSLGAVINPLKFYAAEAINKMTGAAMPQLALYMGQEKMIPEAAQRWWLPKQSHDRIMPDEQQLSIIKVQPQSISKISGILIHTDQDSINKILQSEAYRGSG